MFAVSAVLGGWFGILSIAATQGGSTDAAIGAFLGAGVGLLLSPFFVLSANGARALDTPGAGLLGAAVPQFVIVSPIVWATSAVADPFVSMAASSTAYAATAIFVCVVASRRA